MSAYSDRIIADGASYYWRLNETSGTTAAATVGGAPGTISGGVTLNQPGALSDGDKAMTFDGTTGKITTGPVVFAATTLTLEVWVRTAVAELRNFLATRPGSGAAAFQFGTNGTGRLTFYLEPGGQWPVGTRNIADGLWHHIVFALNGTVWTLYIDGAVDPPTSGSTTTITSATLPLNIGYDASGGAPNYWNGQIDEVAIYPLALNAATVSAHYAAATAIQNPYPPGSYPGRVIADGASYYWRLGETSGTTAVATVGGVNGTISGGVTLNQPGALNDGDRAMTFDGVAGAKIQTAATVTVPIQSTIEVWLKQNPASQKPIVTLRPEANFQIATLGIGKVQVWTGTGFVQSVRTVIDNAWHHLAVVLTASDCLIYIDGTFDSTAANVHALQTGPVRIAYDQADNASWIGALDEVAIYPRALSAAEIAAHYALASAGGQRPISWGYYTSTFAA